MRSLGWPRAIANKTARIVWALLRHGEPTGGLAPCAKLSLTIRALSLAGEFQWPVGPAITDIRSATDLA
ncbi:MAG: hypothetical protein AAF713_21610 [Pseudomonadota bacterium]